MSSQPGAFLSTLGIEIARYNATLQHQTVQQHATHSANSPLIKTRLEVLRLMEQISETHSALLSESILQVIFVPSGITFLAFKPSNMIHFLLKFYLLLGWRNFGSLR